MTNINWLEELHKKEQKAWDQYDESGDPKFLKLIKEYIQEREGLLNKRLNKMNTELNQTVVTL